MRVLFASTNVGGVAFWRLYQFQKKMREKGVDAFLYGYDENSQIVGGWEHQLAYDESVRSDLYGLFKCSDVAVIQYVHIPIVLALLMMMQEKLGKKLVAEIDDEIIDTPNYNPAFKGGWTPGNPFERVVIEHMRISDAVVTSTDFLSEHYKQFNPNIMTIPNCIDVDRWNVAKPKFKNIRIGWIGGGNHDNDLEVMKEVVPEILKRYKDVEFYFVHGVPQYLKDMGSRVKFNTGWKSPSRYPEFVGSWGFDIGLAPLEINKFNMAKSNLRWLEYSALAIPTVATKIEPYEKSIVHGKTGFLCETAQDWVDNISTLIENEKLRKQVGDSAVTDVHENWNLDAVTTKYIKFLKGLI